MQYPNITMRPRFEISEAEEADLARVRRVRQLEEAIYRSPKLYFAVLLRLGEQATQHAEPDELGEEQTSLSDASESDDPADQLRAHFADHGYRGEFDDETEEALAHDPDHKTLLAQHMESRAGSFSANRQEALRAAVQRSRMAYFIGRASVWNEQHATAPDLPNTG
ncbi:MAG TPA: hypothetical protein VFL85_00860 [Candidatus Saccharimonadales bacterium]|nr:hypothetical protein [Candidatus Saccharimonadales bacterium]